MKTSEMKKLMATPRPSEAEQQAARLYSLCRVLISEWQYADEAALVMATGWLSTLADELPRPDRSRAAGQLADLMCSLVVEQDDEDSS